MNRIIVATDFSTRCDRALRRAMLIARRTGAPLTLVHVVDADWPEQIISTSHSVASGVLEETVNTIMAADGIEAEYLVKVDDVYSGILTAADEVRAGLIVVGPHRNRIRDVFLGTTVERIVRQSGTPLLVAVQSPSAAYRRTLLALDFDEASATAGRAALAMGVFENTDVVVMHAFDTPAEGMMQRSLETRAAITIMLTRNGKRRRTNSGILPERWGWYPLHIELQASKDLPRDQSLKVLQPKTRNSWWSVPISGKVSSGC